MTFLGIPRIKKTVAENYDILTWMLCVFLGGSINVGFLNAFSNYSRYWVTVEGVLDTPAEIGLLVLLIILAVTLPLVLSLLLTSIQSSHLIVPPFYITLVSVAWIVIFWVNASNIMDMLAPTLTVGVAYSAVGYGEDWVATKILGKRAEREGIYFEHLRVYANIEAVKARLLIPEIRQGLHISEKIEETKEGLLFKSRSFPFKAEITITKDTEYTDLTSVKVVYYEIGNYSLQVSPLFIEQMHKMSLYITDVFNNHIPAIPVEIITPYTNKVLDSAIDRVIDSFQGYYRMSKQLALVDKITIAAFIGILVLAGILFAIEQTSYAILSIAIEGSNCSLGVSKYNQKEKNVNFIY